MKCKTCGEDIKSNCDWRQGRCPHLKPMLNFDIQYKARFLNLIKAIRNFFK